MAEEYTISVEGRPQPSAPRLPFSTLSPSSSSEIQVKQTTHWMNMVGHEARKVFELPRTCPLKIEVFLFLDDRCWTYSSNDLAGVILAELRGIVFVDHGQVEVLKIQRRPALDGSRTGALIRVTPLSKKGKKR